MQSENRVFDDFVKFVNGAAGGFAGMVREGEQSARDRVREWMGGMDFVSREEFDAVKQMAAEAREEADALKQRVETLEAAAAKSARPRGNAAKGTKSSE